MNQTLVQTATLAATAAPHDLSITGLFMQADIIVKIVMTMLMMLAFLIDQVLQLCCNVYQKARKHVGTLRGLFEKVRNRIAIGMWESWHHLYTFIGGPSSRPPPIRSGWLIA